MLDGLADPGTSAEDLSGQMEALWTMGDEVIVDTLARSADLYFAAGEHTATSRSSWGLAGGEVCVV